MTVESPKVHFAYTQIPYQRNQDVVRITQRNSPAQFIASIVDGYSNQSYLPGDQPGKTIARFVAEHYPQQFFSLSDEDISQKAKKSCSADR